MALLLDGSRITRIGAGGLLALALLGILFFTEAPAQSTDEATINWIREHAVQVDHESLDEITAGDLRFLDQELEGKRFVYLGVSDHWIHEKYAYRLMLIRYLFARGWRYVGMEMDYSDGERVDRYLDTGDVSWLKSVALYGYRGGWRDDRDDIPQGFPGMENPAFREAFLGEEHRFLAALRSLNETRPPGTPRLRWFGFDVGLFPSVGYEEVRAALERYSREPLVQKILERLSRVPGESRIQEAERLDGLAQLLTGESQRLEEILGKAEAKRLTRTVRHLAETYRFCDAAKEGPRTMKWIQGLRDREAGMAWLMDDILEELPSDAKVILMGHNLHLSKYSEEISFGPTGSPAPTMWESIGTHLAKRYPGEVYSIWMLCDHGRHGTLLSPAGVEELDSNTATIEHLMAEAGSSFFLKITSDDKSGPLYDRRFNFLHNGSVASGPLSAQADAVFFVREVTEPVK